MTSPKTPREVARELCDNPLHWSQVSGPCIPCDRIEAVLIEAHARGKREGLEEASDEAVRFLRELSRDDTLTDERKHAAGLAVAIVETRVRIRAEAASKAGGSR